VLESVPVGQIHDDDIRILVGALAAIVTALIGMLWLLVRTLANSREAALKASGAYDAVNGAGPGEHRLYDKVGHIAADVEHLVEVNKIFQARGYDGMDEDLSTGPALQHTIREIQQADVDVGARLDEIMVMLVDHIEREKRRDGVTD